MSAAADRWWRSGHKPTIESVTCIAATALLVWLVLYPLAVLLLGSLRTDLPMRAGRFTLANFITLFADPANLQAIINTVISSGLATILAVAASEAIVTKGAGLLAVYSLGLGVPFVLAALAVEPFAKFLTRFRAHLAHMEKIMGGLLVATGLAFLFGFFTQFNSWLIEAFPALSTLG